MGLISKTKPLSVEFGFGLGKESAEHDSEGRLEHILVFKPKMKRGQIKFNMARLITAEFDTFYLVTTYVPNAGKKLITLDKRMRWDPMFRSIE